MQNNIEESYILREYYKGFVPEQVDLIKIKDKINKINRETILSYVIDQNKELYRVISENYKNTYEIFDKITVQINTINNSLINQTNQPTTEDDSILYQFKYHTNSDDEDQTNNTTLTNFNDVASSFNKEPFALAKINEIILQNQNEIQLIKNEISARNNLIINMNKSIQDKTNYISEAEKEKEFFIENIEEKFFIDELISDMQYNLIELVFKDFLNMSDTEMNLNQQDLVTLKERKFTLIQLFNKKSKKEIKKKLLTADRDLLVQYPEVRLKQIKQTLESIRKEIIETEKESDAFYFIYKSLKEIYEISIVMIKIEEEKKNIQKEEIQKEECNKRLEDISKKIRNFENIKREIAEKYENSKAQKGTKKLKSSSKKEEKFNERRDEINNLKLLISQMENNYVSLLKVLGKKMIKPKNLIRKPDQSFFQSKIK